MRVSLDNQKNFSYKDEILSVINKQKTPHINISYSLLDKFDQCPRAVFFQLVVPRGVAPQNAAPFIGGSVAHKLFEFWAKNTNYQEHWLLNNYKQYFEGYEHDCAALDYSTEKLGQEAINDWGCKTPRDYQVEKVRRSLEPFEKFVYATDLWRHDVQFERWLTVPIPNSIFTLKGSLDIFDRSTRTIYDIKITTNTSYGNLLQLQFYSMLVYLADKSMPIYASFLLPLCKQLFYRSFTPEMADINVALSKVKNFIDAFYNNEFPLTSTGQPCYYCNFKSYCPKYGGVYIRREDY